MYTVVYTPEADAQLTNILIHISLAASPEIAMRFTNAIVEQCENLSTFPLPGSQRDDIRKGVRMIGFRRRVSIAFEVTGNQVLILGIFYGGQDYESALLGVD